MATFSTNQARQLYVATAVNTVNSDATIGTIEVAGGGKDLYIKHKGYGGEVRSDLVNVDNILYAKVTPAADMARSLKVVTVTLDTNVHGETPAPIVGQDYILRINFRQFASLGDENTYIKYGAVHAVANMTAPAFYVELALSLAKNFSRELTKLVEIGLTDGSTVTTVTAATAKTSLTGTYTGVVITEAKQEWTLGIKPLVPVYFDVIPTTVLNNGEEVVWGVTTSSEGATIGNGEIIADLEYFCMGERGDIYRNIGWPHSIPTKYLVDPTQTYDVIDIHYAYVGSNEAVQKSEKDLTIVCDPSITDSVVEAINTQVGTAILG